jgi:hypothetical protein
MESLIEIGTRYGTDKVRHGFCPFYDKYLSGIRANAHKILEIGIHRGASLLMWNDYFNKADIHGMDLMILSPATGNRIYLHTGNQSDRNSLDNLMQETGTGFDLIVDDGGHTMQQQQISFGALFPHVRPGGYYVIEDLHTSFMKEVRMFRGGRLINSYKTGVAPGVWTTYQIVSAIQQRKTFVSSFMLDEERIYIENHVGHVDIFDRDGDHKHMTSILTKTD